MGFWQMAGLVCGAYCTSCLVERERERMYLCVNTFAIIDHTEKGILRPLWYLRTSSSNIVCALIEMSEVFSEEFWNALFVSSYSLYKFF